MTIKLGWCITGHHDKCWVKTGVECPCECHLLNAETCDTCGSPKPIAGPCHQHKEDES